MRILMIAPQPYFQYRGTPFSIRERLKALTKLGHSVDLVTYHIGQRIEIPGVRVFRSWPLPFLKNVPIGPSWVKFPLDFLLALRVLFLLPVLRRIDFVHSHEEGALFGGLVAKLLGKPHVYDMHSSLPQQLINYDFTKPRALLSLAQSGEAWIVRNSEAVIVVCPWLERVVTEIRPNAPVFLIENPPICPPADPSVMEKSLAMMRELGLEGKQVVLYTGTFEVNQGLEIALASITKVMKRKPNCIFLFVGGEPHQVTALRAAADEMGVGRHTLMLGQRPPGEMPVFMELASVLISPRKVGQNTPLKVYSYLQSGRPIVATDLETHRQVLDDTTAILVEPNLDAFADGILSVLDDENLAGAIGKAGKALLSARYSWDRFVENTSRFCTFMQRLAQ
jgi:glycosyltransferase involved in cell wall biosynthesis